MTSESCKDPLDFAKQILSSVSQHVVNLTIRRPPVAASANEGVRLRSPLDVKLRGMALRKVSGQSENYSSYPKPNKLFSTHVSVGGCVCECVSVGGCECVCVCGCRYRCVLLN